MKYNKSEIMKAAWNMVKVAGITISAALKNAWAAAKSVIKTIVDGTDKQNAWANEILRKPIAQVKESISWLEVEIKYGHTVKSIEPLRAAIAEYETRLVAFADTLTARFVIDNRAQFSRMMYNIVAKSLKAAGLNGTHTFCKA